METWVPRSYGTYIADLNVNSKFGRIFLSSFLFSLFYLFTLHF
jgi:hypothetical protein